MGPRPGNVARGFSSFCHDYVIFFFLFLVCLLLLYPEYWGVLHHLVGAQQSATCPHYAPIGADPDPNVMIEVDTEYIIELQSCQS